MKKLYTLLVVALIGFMGNAQIVNIPDAAFKAKLLSASATINVASSQPLVYNSVTNTYSVSSYNKIDTNNDGQIQISEAQAITYLKLINPTSPFLDNITGIQSFTSLQYLDCSDVFYASFTNLNLSQNTALKYLNCSNNSLTQLNITGLSNLQTLFCNYNNLTNLNFSGYSALLNLNCSNNQLATLNLFGNNALTYLVCNNNVITTPLNLVGYNSLKTLNCSLNKIPSIDLTGINSITDINCGSNFFLTSLLITSTSLINLDFYYNYRLNNLNLSGLTNLKIVEGADAALYSLSLDGLVNLERLVLNGNNLTQLNTHDLQNLKILSCTSNNLTSLDATTLPKLESLQCDNNSISVLDFSNCPLVSNIDCNNNALIVLNVRNGNILENVFSNNLEFLGNPNIQFVCCDSSETTTVQNKINGYGYTNCRVNSYCPFIPEGQYFIVSGNNRYDSDNNGCSVVDINFPNLQFNYSNGTSSGNFISNVTGAYYLLLKPGSNVITPIMENPTYFTVLPNPTNIVLPSASAPYVQNFCITANGVHNDLEINILPIGIAQPGFDASYKIVYKNKGTDPQNGTVNLVFDDSKMDLILASPIVNSQTVNSLYWNFNNLQPFETREITVKFNINTPLETPAVNNGDILNYDASITGASDESPLDNTSTLNQTVVNSFDPNDKTCIEGTTVSTNVIGKYVHYVIRFENNGTSNATNIAVRDIINTAKYDVSSLLPVNGSATYTTKITNTNQVEFIFQNINLPFTAGTNTGYVAFKIKTKPTLVVGDTFSNSANIYFDYNFPIVTNTYTTTIATLGNQDFDFGSVFILSPVPAKNSLTITAKQDVVISSLSIYNTLGQLVQVSTNPNETIDVSGLQSGSYFIRITSDKGSANEKFIKE